MLPIYIAAIENDEDRNKAAEIYSLYYGTMMSAALSILKNHAQAEDAVSESLIKIIDNLDKISDISCYKTRRYIVIIVENTAINMWRKQVIRKEESEELLETIPDKNITPLDELTSREGVKAITETIHSLPKTLSDVLYLSAAYGYTASEISEELGISYDAVRMRLSRARKAAKQILEGEKDGK